jgi:hypothetical protein
MGETTGAIERDIDASRAALEADLQELEARVKVATDWRYYYRTYTVPLLALAFGGGILLSALLSGGPRRPG